MQYHRNIRHKLFLKKLRKPICSSFITMYSEMPANTIKISRLCQHGLIYRCRFYMNYHSLSDFILRFRKDLMIDLYDFFEELTLNDYSISTNIYKAIVYLETFQRIFSISFSKKNLMPYRFLADAAKPLIFKEWGIAPEANPVRLSRPSKTFKSAKNSRNLKNSKNLKNPKSSKNSKTATSSRQPAQLQLPVPLTTRDPQILAEIEYHAFIFDAAEIFSRWVLQQKGHHKKASVVATQITSLIAYHKREYQRKKRGA